MTSLHMLEDLMRMRSTQYRLRSSGSDSAPTRAPKSPLG